MPILADISRVAGSLTTLRDYGSIDLVCPAFQLVLLKPIWGLDGDQCIN